MEETIISPTPQPTMTPTPLPPQWLQDIEGINNEQNLSQE